MLKKHSVLLGIVIALVLLFIATRYYPGGSQADKNSVGFSFQNNYFSNLFTPTAVNGAPNGSRFWAVAGMFFLTISYALFFIDFSKKIPQKSAANIIKYFGAGSMIFGFLIATPYHDIMVRIAGTMEVISVFYITVFVLRSKLFWLKPLSIALLLVFYTCNFVYYTSTYLVYLPVLQKVLMLLTISWVLSLQYFTTQADFASQKK